MPRLATTLWSVLLVSAALLVTACGDCGKKKSPKTTASKDEPSPAASEAPAETLPSGLVVRVSSGTSSAPTGDRVPPAKSTKLADNESNQLLAPPEVSDTGKSLEVLRYAPADLALEPADHGFTVERRYEAVDDPSDVRRDRDGTWHFRAGARVRVRVEMVTQNRRYHVALVDPLPAGLEPMNPALAATGSIPEDPKEQKSGDRYWGGTAPGTSTRTCATSASRHSRRSYGKASTSTLTSPAPPHPGTSWCRPPRQRRCTTPRPSAAPPPTA